VTSHPWYTLAGPPPGARQQGVSSRLGRIAGVDVARALAVFGMLGAHLGAVAPDVGAPPSTWTGVVNGWPSILFAVLAGTSVALLSGRTAPVTADPLPRTVFPLAAVGSMALTAYAGGIVAVAVTGTLDYTTNHAWLVFVVVTTAAATLWRLFSARAPASDS
jgi:Heparan-alpha-glucosaminide N-acetyltransferase, catalytic